MTVTNPTAFVILVLVCALTLLVVGYVIGSLRQWRRTPRMERETHNRRLNTSISAPHLRDTPARPSPAQETLDFEPPRELWNRLTRREKQVARLAAQCKTDAEIAAALSISERTVGNHLSSIYSKLDIHSRIELKYLLREVEDES